MLLNVLTAIVILTAIVLLGYFMFRIVSDTKKLYKKTNDKFIKMLLWSKR